MWSLTFDQLTEIAKIVGLVAAGLWTAWTFYSLQKIQQGRIEIEKSRVDTEKARIDIEKSRVDMEKSRVDMDKSRVDTEKDRVDIQKSRVELDEIREKIRSQQPQLSVHLDVSEAESHDPSYKTILTIAVILTNEGTQHLWIGFSEYTITVGRITFGKDGRQRLSSAVHLSPTYIAEGAKTSTPFLERILKIGQTRRMMLALPVTAFGSYLIQFSAVYARADLIDDKKTRRDNIIVNAVEQSFYTATGKAATLAPPLPVVQNS